MMRCWSCSPPYISVASFSIYIQKGNEKTSTCYCFFSSSLWHALPKALQVFSLHQSCLFMRLLPSRCCHHSGTSIFTSGPPSSSVLLVVIICCANTGIQGI